MFTIGYTRCKTDLFLYYKHEAIAVVGVYVDDLLATGINSQMIQGLFGSLKVLEFKDLGIVRKLLGMRIQFENGGYSLDQETLIREYLQPHSPGIKSCTKTPTATSH